MNDSGISKPKILLILLVVLVFFLGLFAGSRIFYQDNIYPSTTNPPLTSATTQESLSGEDIDPASVYLINLSEEEVEKVQVSNAAGQMLFVAETDKSGETKTKTAADTVYKLSQPDWDIINHAEVQTLVQSLFSIRFKRVVSEEKTETEYGFDRPTASIVYFLADQSQIKLEIGLPQSGADSYARRNDDNKVYLVSGMADRTQRGPLSLLKDSLDTIDNKSIKQFSFQRNSDQSNLTFAVINKNISPIVSPTAAPSLSPVPGPSVTPAPPALGDRKWELVSPLRWDAKSSDINSMVSEFATLFPQEYVDYGNINFAEYGLDKPDYVVTLQSEYEETVLQIGASAGAGQRFARIVKYPLVFVLNMSQLSMLNRSMLDLINPYLASININSVQVLDVETAEREIHAEIMVPTKAELAADPDIKESFVVNGREANISSSNASEHYFKQFYRSVIALQLDGVDLTAPVDYAAEFKIMYTLKSDLTDIPTKAYRDDEGRILIRLDFVSRDNDSYYVYLNGQASGFYILKTQLDTNRNGMQGYEQTWARLYEAINNQLDGIYDIPVEDDDQ